MLSERKERSIRRSIKEFGLTPMRSLCSLEKQFAEICHKLRGEGMSRDRISTKLRVSFAIIKWIFEQHPCPAETVACACGCGKTFTAGNGRKFFDPKKCRERYIDKGGEVLSLPAPRVKASHREVYCHQRIDGEWIECINYPKTCGVECLRKENGQPVCFVRPPEKRLESPSWVHAHLRKSA